MSGGKWACFNCRVTYNREHPHCPTCKGPLLFAGKYFKPPRRNAVRQWEALAILVSAGVSFSMHITRLMTPHLDRFAEGSNSLSDTELKQAMSEGLWALEQLYPPMPLHETAVPKTPRAAHEYLGWLEGERQHYIDLLEQLGERLRDHWPDEVAAIREKMRNYTSTTD